jgi:hypothetical protein
MKIIFLYKLFVPLISGCKPGKYKDDIEGDLKECFFAWIITQMVVGW